MATASGSSSSNGGSPMTTPAFSHLISVNTDHRLDELQRVATDLRNERTFSAPQPEPRRQRGPNRIRLAIGSALLRAGSALVSSQSRPSVEAR